ncbi:MAG: cold shock domain-containing protein [Bryobacterales bacterium]|nr:cold shock domain-containing protein [Bryobacterales bacterium]
MPRGPPVTGRGCDIIKVPGHQDIFVHYSAIRMPGRKILLQGQEVDFEIKTGAAR